MPEVALDPDLFGVLLLHNEPLLENSVIVIEERVPGDRRQFETDAVPSSTSVPFSRWLRGLEVIRWDEKVLRTSTTAAD